MKTKPTTQAQKALMDNKQHLCRFKDCQCILAIDRDDCSSKALHKCNHPSPPQYLDRASDHFADVGKMIPTEREGWEKILEDELIEYGLMCFNDAGEEDEKAKEKEIISWVNSLLSSQKQAICEDAKEEAYKNVGSWFKLPEYKDFHGMCSSCGGNYVVIRGKYPHTPKRKICPTCTR